MQLIRSEDYEDEYVFQIITGSKILSITLNQLSNFYYFFSLMIDQFSPSVKMSTYLLAIAVLDNFSKVRKMTKRTDKPVEVITLTFLQ